MVNDPQPTQQQSASKDWNTYPVTLRVRHIMEILEIGETKARQLLHSKGFPAYRVGRQIRVDRSQLREWVIKQPRLQ